MERIEEFTREGKNFLYIDFSGFSCDDEHLDLVKKTEPVIEKYPGHSLYTITNIANLRFDSETKKIAADFIIHNAPYVKYGAIIGLDGIKKMMAYTVMKLSGRTNLGFAFSREGAIEWLLQQK